MNLAQWLSVHHLDALAPRLIEAGIDCDILEELTDSDLAEAGLTLGDRRRLLKAIRESDVPAGDTLPAVQAQSSPVPPGERRHLTVMFCDLVGSTALSARLDPEDLRELVARYHQLASSIIQRFGGFAAQFMGDGVMAFFGYPTAHEDDAEHAVRAGLALVKELTGAELTPGERVAVRVGIATGEVVVGELGAPGTAQENAAIGETPNLAARLQAMGEPGTVVISSATRELTSGAFEYRDMGSHLLRGLREPVTVSQVLRLSDAVSRFEARHDQSLDALVGRDREIAHLHSCWHAAASGSGQVVLIGAEPGLGKSRIVAALQHALEEEGARVRRHFCSPYHSDSPLHPFAAQLSRACALTSGQSQSERLARVVAAMGADSPPAASDLQLVAELLGIEVSDANDAVPASPAQKRSRLFELLLADLERAAAGCPVLLVFEDAHWSDPTSLELLRAIIARAAALKVMVVITHRPEFVSPWGHPAHLQTLALDRLDRTAAAKIVTRVAQGRALPPALLEDILARTDGVPLFIEELTRSILESGALRTTRDGFELVGPVTMSTVPMSLSASLLARLDRLTLSRAIAQTGAAIGREFSRDLLADVLRMPPARLEAALAEICASGLIVERIEDPGPLYVFKHALIQEVAYSTLLRSRRQQLHGLIAAAMEGRFPEVVGRQPELLARHLAEAGLAERAIGAYRRAGQLALSRSASVEAATHLRHALALLSSLPPAVMREPLELALQTALGVALSGIGGYSAADAVSAFERARVLVRSVGSQEGVGAIFDGLFINYTNRGDLTSSMEIGREFLAIARQSGDAPSESVANRMLGVVYRVLGQYPISRGYCERAVALSTQQADTTQAWRQIHDPGVAARCNLGIITWHMGEVERSLSTEQEATVRAAEIGHVNTLGFALGFIGCMSAYRRRDFVALDDVSARLVAHGQRYRMPTWEMVGIAHRGRMLIERGQASQGIEELRTAMAAFERMQAHSYRPLYLGMLAEGYMALNCPDEAIIHIDDGIAMGESTGERCYTPELWRLRALAERSKGTTSALRASESALQCAMRLAREQGSAMLEVRAACDLAEMQGDLPSGNEMGGGRIDPMAVARARGLDSMALMELRERLGLFR